ncbi:DUF6456 domain-containing protein [Sphingomonas sp. GlSt437]|uniref:DUF6456 domain-containing protein n=1 Tax=Sphingomonas sp. GlSt437 TaxID=3389970 RepID=UPI003A8A5435
MKQQLVERAVDAFGVSPRTALRRGSRSVTVNLAESTLGWLAARGLVSARQLEAAERLRRDYEGAALAPSVTMRWDAARVDGGGWRPNGGLDPTTAQISAKRRFDDAMANSGQGLSDILWRVACADEPMAHAERALGWPARSGRVVLGIALDRLADHYRLP